MATVEIRNESDLFEVLDRLRRGEELGDEGLEFIGWPNFEITIRGEHFDGGVPTRIMPSLLKLQQSVDKAFSRVKYGTVRRLSNEEKKQTELVVRFEAGKSTTFFSELWPILNNMGQQAVSKMNGTEALIAVLGTAAFLAGGWAWKSYLNARTAARELDHKLDMSREETRRMETVAQIASEHAQLQEQIGEINQFQTEVLKRLAPEDSLVVEDNPLIDGKTAHLAVRKPREEPVESRYDGNFLILSVESGMVKGGFRLKIRDVTSGEEMMVNVPEGTLDIKRIETLQDGEWGKKALHLKLNVKKIGGKIKEATLIEAGLSGQQQ